ncbi:MAG: hypothetical protein Q9208_001335 [Pyrenodesmia sp. 3 TL-2023]
MSLLHHPLKRIFSTAPIDLFHFTPFPGRFVENALIKTSNQYYNGAVVRDGNVDPHYKWRDARWRSSSTEIPKTLQLLQQDNEDFEGVYVLQPKEPMPLQTLNKTIRDFQIDIVTDGDTRHPLAGEKPSRVMRLHDWMTADNPLMNRYPEIMEGYIPDKEGNSYGKRYTWETVRLVRKPVLEGYT